KMKNLSILLLLLCGISPRSQTLSVKGIQKYCEYDKYDSRQRHLTVTQNDSVIIKNVKTEFGEFEISGLKAGFYTFQYTNIFGQAVRKEILVSLNKNPIIICVDKFQETNEKTLFSEITEDDKVTINYSSTGCFSFVSEMMEFSYEGRNLIGKLYIEHKLTKTQKLRSESLEYLIDFEKKGRQMKNNLGGCTNTDLYVFQLNGKTEFSIDDSSCDWDGYMKLRKKLFNYKK
ncbi:MAG TPA: hypothetical protein PLP06_12655, partial [Saprospiraceae bacterium]|nr:hypothetical protein [Saprospiraceae bacterium]